MQRILTTGKRQLTERPEVHVPSNFFNMSHSVKLTCNMGELVPCMYLEALPGDKFDMTSEIMLRLQPMIAPMMQRCTVRTESFFVPNRIVWPGWENFMSQPPGLPIPAIPSFNGDEHGTVLEPGDLANYLGIPYIPPYQTPPVTNPYPEITMPFIPNILPFGAYSRIVFDWYQNRELLSSVGAGANEFVPLQDGDNEVLPTLAHRNWDLDYLTTAMPAPQKGPEVRIPGDIVLNPNSASAGVIVNGSTHAPVGAGSLDTDAYGNFINGSGTGVVLDPKGSLISTGTIEQLRTAEAVLEYMEAENRGGLTYQDHVLGHYGVHIPDDRINRSEYLGSTSQPLVIGEVLNTTGTSQLPQGNMSGHGISVARHEGHSTYYATEHGFFMTILSIIPDTSYADGMEKQFTRTSRLDYYSPEFAHIGEQPITNGEVWYNFYDSTQNSKTWGYVPRYNEYRTKMNRVCGEFATSLRYWTQVRRTGPENYTNFHVADPLDANFIQIDPAETLDVFAVIDETVAHCLLHFYHEIKMQRKMPLTVKPTL